MLKKVFGNNSDYVKVEDKNITNFIISITDDEGNYINFNNQDTQEDNEF